MDETNNNIKVLTNGAIYDFDTHRIVSGAALSSDKARAMVARRVEIRRDIVKNSANEAVNNGDLTARYGDFAWLAAIAAAAVKKATNAADPKMIEAARWLQESTGESESGESAGDSGVAELRGLVRDIAELARAVAAGQAAAGQGPVIEYESK